MSDAVSRLNAALEGRYSIERELGEGGMATVYLADDLKHERKVALKVLKPELAAVVGAERFLAEIKTTANLQHPHILPLFDSGEAEGFLFYVMPYVEGETLRDRIDREKQLPVEEAVALASKVAGALQHAHEHGVIHRDIKPGNILLQGGEPVVSDFGIALAVGAAGSNRLTETGLSLGTPYYMSPEQATGDQVVGASTDTYALGSVLYEMLTGDPPYMGSTAQAVLGQIISAKAISATEKRPSIPANVDAAVRKALEKLPADRFTSAQDFVRALGDEYFRYGELATAGADASVGPWKRLTMAFATLAAATTLIAGWSLLRPQPPQPVAQFESPFREGQAPVLFGPPAFNLSPDGSMLVYQGPSETGNQLWVRRWDDPDATPVRGTGGALRPAVSPDGQQLAFDQAGVIKVLSFQGGPVTSLTEGQWSRWGPDGYIYYYVGSSNTGPMMRVPATGGPPESVTELAEREQFHRISDFPPGGDRALMHVQFTNIVTTQVRALRLDTGEMSILTPGTFPRYASTGHLTFLAADGSLMAAPFDPRLMEITGPSVPMIGGVAAYALSETGSLVYSPTNIGSGGEIELSWVTRAGDAAAVDPGLQFNAGFGVGGSWGWSLSPDGRRIAVSRIVDGNADIWTKQLPDGPFERLTFDSEMEMSPGWSTDGQYVVYSRGPGATVLSPWQSRADGTGVPERLLDDPRPTLLQGRQSANGEWMVFRQQSDIVVFRPGGDSTTVPLVATQFQERGPALSPDGRWLAYSSFESGREEVYVRPFPDVESDRDQVSTNGGSNPRWATSGDEVFFVDADRRMNAAQVETASEFRVLERQVLFTLGTDYVGYGGVADGGDDFYDVEPGGQRFLMGRAVGAVDCGR